MSSEDTFYSKTLHFSMLTASAVQF